MDFSSVIVVIAVVVVGLAVVVAVRRRDQSVREEVEKAVAGVVDYARDAFDSRLATGKTELENQHRSFREQVEGFKGEVNTLRGALTSMQNAAAQQHGTIEAQLKRAASGTSELTKTTSQLKDVLSNPTARGKWGERMAEDVLRVAGMQEGPNYVKQTRLRTGKIPDYTFLLPKDERLHMDVKFPLSAHSEYIEATSDAERKEAARKLGLALRSHVNSLVGREGYLDERETVGCVLMFIPNDGVYAAIHERCQDEVDKALEKGVLICSPSTLLAVLVIVRKAMDTFALERSSQEILDALRSFETQWDNFAGAIETVSSRADSLRKSVDQLMPGGTRRNVLDRELSKIELLRTETDPTSLGSGELEG